MKKNNKKKLQRYVLSPEKQAELNKARSKYNRELKKLHRIERENLSCCLRELDFDPLLDQLDPSNW